MEFDDNTQTISGQMWRSSTNYFNGTDGAWFKLNVQIEDLATYEELMKLYFTSQLDKKGKFDAWLYELVTNEGK